MTVRIQPVKEESIIKSPNTLKLPEYLGSETCFEDIVYSFFRLVMNFRGYSFKVKRTGFAEIDSIIPSYTKGNVGRGSCDGYLFSSDKYESFCGLLELESTGNLEQGIKQIKNYVEGFTSETLTDSQKRVVANISQRDIRLIVFDGQEIYISLYNIDDKSEIVIFDKLKVSAERDEVINKIHSLFPVKQQIDREIEEKKIVGDIARIIRGHEKLQKNKAFIMTILACIYGSTKENDLYLATKLLRESQFEFDIKLYEMWRALDNDISDTEDQKKIVRLYEETSSQLYELSQERGMDLYGFIYEELATKDTKKEQGEYYTPRHTIRPIISAVFNNYLNWGEEELKDKVVLDPFCGSGGFLYEYVNFINSQLDIGLSKVGDVVSNSLWGFDKNGTLSAELNLYLIGNINANLSKVKTSINWRKHFLYENHKKNKYDVNVLGPDDVTKIKRKLRASYSDIKNFLMMYAGTKINVDIKEIEDLIDTKIENNESLETLLEEYALSKLDLLTPNKDERSLGNVDLLITNVPYGKVTEANEQIIEQGAKIYGNSLEVNALRECIDLLKPATLKNGKRVKEGGVGIIIVPDSILENATNKPIRDYLISRCDILSIISLPDYTFAPYAMEKTYVLVIQKIAPDEFSYSRNLDFKTFMYSSNSDGRANSQNRYRTNHLREVEIKYPVDKKKRVVEFIHNDFEPSFEPYTDGETKYMSKLERAWTYSTFVYNPEWDQERLKEVWVKDGWEKKKGKKWGYYEIKRITREQKVIIRKASLENKISEFLSNKTEEEKSELISGPIDSNFVKELLSEVKLTPSERELLKSVDNIEETFILGEQKILMFKIELIDDVDLNIDSSNYLGIKEQSILIEDLQEILDDMEIVTEEEMIDFFRNTFTSNQYDAIKLMDKFDIIQGTQFSKEDAYLNPGSIPVFTAATDGPAYYVSDNIEGKVKVNGPSLIWSRKGAKAGTIQLFDEKNENGQYNSFYISDVSGTVKPKSNLQDYDLTFLKFYIAGQVKKELQSVSNNAQLNKSKLENLTLFLPDNQSEIGKLINKKIIK